MSAREPELRSMPYQDYLQTPEWGERASDALQRAGHRCQVCQRNRECHVHHRTYQRRGAELPADLIVLCDECLALHQRMGLIAGSPRPMTRRGSRPGPRRAPATRPE
jgi:hypothetical protein